MQKKKILFFDCFSGISGDMTLGALLDLGLDRQTFLNELEKLHVDGYKISFDKAVKNGITGNYVKVHLADGCYGEEEHDGGREHHGVHHHAGEHKSYGADNHDGEREHFEGHNHHGEHTRHLEYESHGEHVHQIPHEHHHDSKEHFHEHRNLTDINRIIDASGIAPGAKDLAKRIFLRVAKAEGKVHNRKLEEVHFHEVGAVDSIVDIVGTAILMDMLRPDMVCASVIQDGRGFVKCQHGKLAVPVPAVSEIFADSGAVTRQIDIETELVTPTGAAIIAELASSYGNMPEMNVRKIGWGAGTKDLEIPNLLKVSLGEYVESDVDFTDKEDPVMVLETNLDDCTGEHLGYVMERLFEQGALDVFFTPIFMKKNRPAYRMTVICTPVDMRKMEELIFRHTTTIGLRKRLENRTVLPRKKDVLHTKYGELEVKIAAVGAEERIYPEYESAKKLATQHGVPLNEIYRCTCGDTK